MVVGTFFVGIILRKSKKYNKYLEKCVNVLNLKFGYDTIQMFVTVKIERIILMGVR